MLSNLAHYIVPKEISDEQHEQYIDRQLFEMQVVSKRFSEPSISWAMRSLEVADTLVGQLAEDLDQTRRKIKELKKGYSPQPGVSLRDYFAGLALQGLIGKDPKVGSYREAPPDVVRLAYSYADQMLAAREGDADGG